MAYYSSESSTRRPRVRFSQDDQQYYSLGPPQRSWNDASQPSPRRRRQQRSYDDYAPERVHLATSATPPWTRLERRMPLPHDDHQPPAVIVRRRRNRSYPHDDDHEKVAPIAVAGLSRPSPYSESPPPVENDEENDFIFYQQSEKRNADRGSNRSRSRSPQRMYYTERISRNRAAKSAEPEVIVLDDDQNDRDYRPSSPIGGDLDAYDEFSFLFPRTDSNNGELSDLESPAVDMDSVHHEDRDTSMPSNAKKIYSSAYAGSAEPGGVHAAKLTELLDPKGKQRSLFRWHHIHQQVMNFTEFWTEISRQFQFSELERSAIAKLRADIQKHCLKTRQNPKGVRVGYMEPRCFEVPLKSMSKQVSGQEKPDGSARWICLPYFSLQKYSGLLSGSSVFAFPPQTLLQAQYSRTTEQRDMQQAVCRVNATNQDECFHIAQMWCLVLDNCMTRPVKFNVGFSANAAIALIVTCGAMSELDLCRDSVELKSQLSPGGTGAGLSGRIIVKYGNAVTWAFSVVDCSTWFKFLSMFHAFWPRNLEFRYNYQAVSAENWKKVLQLAARPQGGVMLTMKIIPRPSPPHAVLGPLNPEVVNDSTSKPCKKVHEYLHVLMLQPSEVHSRAKSGTEQAFERLKEQLNSAENFLTGQTSYADQRAYKSCGDVTREDLYSYLVKQASQVEEKASDSIRLMHEDRIDIFNAATDTFNLFFPLNFDGPTTGKFWGGIKPLLKIPQLEEDFEVQTISIGQHVTTEVKSILRDISQDVQRFQSIMSHADEKERDGIELPRQFVTAWLHIVSGLISAYEESDAWLAHMFKAKRLILDGMNHTIQAISSNNLLENSAVMPLEIVSLFSLNLLHDQVGKSDDIIDIYAQYLALLDDEITSQPSDRAYQHRLDLVQQELTVIRRTVAKQRTILGSIRANCFATDATHLFTGAIDDGPWRRRRQREAVPWRDEPTYANPGPHAYYNQHEAVPRRQDIDYIGLQDQEPADLEAASRLSPTDELGFRVLLLNECLQLIEQRDFDLRRHTDYADDLERAVVYGLDWTKDRQENAIYAFTIVTVVFLPLSAISSIFGMNTSDVRDMEYGQWLYWAVALPVTMLIIVIGLWWMGELGNVVKWLSGRQTNRISNAGYVPGVAPQMMEETTYVVEPPSTKTQVDYPETRMGNGGTSRSLAYAPEQGVMRRSRRRPQSIVRY
ncbi:hypothetical protein QQS21_011400 [Conoideocrella luteorostrata]|uniref:Cora-domain-containing protein n=1 Tax=Conoideocrella luteorostrata TaxID=1105319 RepID=A0AAJ0CDB5_9HYPO|nr:hypothetical protein QQS21_011400 [Conoideocrella luteorostrata]